ncbi:MAG: GNAT family N-acetyltransferase [Bacteroidota bacterium]
MNSSETAFRILPATREQVPLILEFIRKLAAYEKLSHEVVATEELLDRFLFGPEKVAEVVIGWLDDEAVGFALFYRSFSTFLARPGIYLEDLFVKEEFRGRGFGKALLVHLARITRDRGYGRLEWAVLDWNKPAIDFYKSLGSRIMEEWLVNRVSGEALTALADRDISTI